MKSVLITGSSGLLGKDILNKFLISDQFKVCGLHKTPNINKEPYEIIGDMTDSVWFNNVLKSVQPDLIIHCAAIVDLNFCENNRELTNDLHLNSTEAIVNYNSGRTKIIFISTDSVFNGKKGNYKETDEPEPINYYAESKIKGERIVLSNLKNLVIRTNIFGFGLPLKNSLAEWAIKNIIDKSSINGFTDVIFNAIYTKHLAELIFNIVEIDLNGIINIGSANSISKYSFLKYLELLLNGEYGLVSQLKSDQFNFQIPRPKNTTLNTERISQYFQLPTVEEGLEELIKDYFEVKNENH